MDMLEGFYDIYVKYQSLEHELSVSGLEHTMKLILSNYVPLACTDTILSCLSNFVK